MMMMMMKIMMMIVLSTRARARPWGLILAILSTGTLATLMMKMTMMHFIKANSDKFTFNPLITVPAVTGRDFAHVRVLFLLPLEGHFLSPIVLIVFRMD